MHGVLAFQLAKQNADQKKESPTDLPVSTFFGKRALQLSASNLPPTPKRRKSTASCKCHRLIPDAFKDRIGCKKDKKAAKGLKKTWAITSSIKTTKGLLDKLIEYEDANYPLCYAHAQAVASKLLLMTKGLDHKQIKERLRIIHRDFEHLGKLKTDEATFTWFRKAGRPVRPTDHLGPYRHFHNVDADQFLFDEVAILNSFDPRILPAWELEGTVMIEGAFSWWWEDPGIKGMRSIGAIVEEEFSMYQHHLREINGKDNLGWQRNQLYSIGQQLMRMDPLYYTLYACLRPDKQWRLISYPYYTKHTMPGDATGFRHLDLDLKRLAEENRGAQLIQGSLSLVDEQEDDCTEIVPRLHKHTSEWYQRIVARGGDASGLVNRIERKDFTREDARYFNTDWKAVPAQRGTVRISKPHLPHGAMGPCVRTRSTMLPWYVGIQPCHSALDLYESGTWESLADSHRTQTAPEASPSGFSNNYGAIPYKFPASVQVRSLGALSDALVGRVRWDDPMVIQERNIYLGKDRAKAARLLKVWRQDAIVQANRAFKVSKDAEMMAFGSKSYFARKAQGLYGQLDADVDPNPVPYQPSIVSMMKEHGKASQKSLNIAQDNMAETDDEDTEGSGEE